VSGLRPLVPPDDRELARASAELRFDQAVIGARYAALYREILAAPTSGQIR
jgi:hypothetical protein